MGTSEQTVVIPQHKTCPQCGTTYRLQDEEGHTLPRERLAFGLVRAPQYAGGVRLRSICDGCHRANEQARRAAHPRRRLSPEERQAVYAARSRAAATARESQPGYIPWDEALHILGVSRGMVHYFQRRGILPRPLTREAVEQFAAQRARAKQERERAARDSGPTIDKE